METDTTGMFDIAAELIWPVRANIADCKFDIELHRRIHRVRIDYPPSIELAPEIVVPSVSWTRLSIAWKQKFQGSQPEFHSWAQSAGGTSKLLEAVETVQSEVVDRLYRLPANDQPLVMCIRHFGPRDWIAVNIGGGGVRFLQLVGSGMLHLVSSRLLDPTSCVTANGGITGEEKTLHRAAHLAECGYPTESLLLAFSVLDAAVQRFLRDSIVEKGVSLEAAEGLLRNTTTKRLATYLDSVLHLSTGHSLKIEDEKLFGAVVQLSSERNDAMHNGISIGRNRAKQACVTVLSVLQFLGHIKQGVVADGTQLTFMSTI